MNLGNLESEHKKILESTPQYSGLLDAYRKKMNEARHKNDTEALVFWRSHYEVLHDQCVNNTHTFQMRL